MLYLFDTYFRRAAEEQEERPPELLKEKESELRRTLREALLFSWFFTLVCLTYSGHSLAQSLSIEMYSQGTTMYLQVGEVSMQSLSSAVSSVIFRILASVRSSAAAIAAATAATIAASSEVAGVMHYYSSCCCCRCTCLQLAHHCCCCCHCSSDCCCDVIYCVVTAGR